MSSQEYDTVCCEDIDKAGKRDFADRDPSWVEFDATEGCWADLHGLLMVFLALHRYPQCVVFSPGLSC